MKLVLGTAQFGLEYGVTNNRGQVDEAEVVDILEYAADSGINLIDTAVAYGNSELVLGKHCAKISKFEFISKLKLDPAATTYCIEQQVGESCRRLGVEKLYGLLVHNPDCMKAKKSIKLWESLEQLKYKGLVDRVGVSVYSPQEALDILDYCSIDLLQFPYNLFDQSFNEPAFLSKLDITNLELHARSIFLQGLLLCDIENIPGYFDAIKYKFDKINSDCVRLNITKLQMVMMFLRKNKFIDSFVFGVTSVKELDQIVTSWGVSADYNEDLNWCDYVVKEEHFLNPSLWKVVS